MAYATSGIVGTRVDEASSTQLFTLGQTLCGTDGTEWVYVQASGAITAYDAVGIDENYQAAALTKALADAGHDVGFAQFAFTDNYYGFVAKRGTNISCRLGLNCAPDVALYTSGTAGVLDDTSASQTKIVGVVAVASATSTNATTEVIATYPVAEQPA